jgi:hypothetical protein
MATTGTELVVTVFVVAAAEKQTKSIKQDLWLPQCCCSSGKSSGI